MIFVPEEMAGDSAAAAALSLAICRARNASEKSSIPNATDPAASRIKNAFMRE